MGKYRYTKPVPMPRGTHYGNNYYVFHSRKVGRRVCTFSNLEYDNLITLEMDPEVEYYCERPLKINGKDADGSTYETVFDVWVLYTNGIEEFQEVKYESDIKNTGPESRVSRQIRHQEQWCTHNNFHHRIRTDKDIYQGQYYLTNLKTMVAKVRRYRIDSDTQKRKEKEIMKLLEGGYLTVDKIAGAGIIHPSLVPVFLSMMFYKGMIRFSNIYDAVINGKTEVYV